MILIFNHYFNCNIVRKAVTRIRNCLKCECETTLLDKNHFPSCYHGIRAKLLSCFTYVMCKLSNKSMKEY